MKVAAWMGMAVLAMVASIWPQKVQAQVFRCIDADGAVSFLDSPCPRGQRGGEVTVKPPTAPDAGAARRNDRERERMYQQEDVRRRAFYAGREQEAEQRAALVRDYARKCDNAREQQAYYATRPNFTANGAYHSQKMAEHWASEAKRYCN